MPREGLYGLVRVGWTCNEEINAHMESVGYAAMEKDRVVYIRGPCDRSQRILGWVDDSVVVGANPTDIF